MRRTVCLLLLLAGFSTPAVGSRIVLDRAQPRFPEAPTPHSITESCPSKSMSCYPGCALVNGMSLCGPDLLAFAETLAGAIELIAQTDGLSVEDFCKKNGTLCAEAKSGEQAKPKTFSDDTDCMLRGGGGTVHPGRQRTCRYVCNGEEVELILDPPEVFCPGQKNQGGSIKWSKIKRLPQKLKR